MGFDFLKLEVRAWTKEKNTCFPGRKEFSYGTKGEEPIAETDRLLVGRQGDHQEKVLSYGSKQEHFIDGEGDKCITTQERGLGTPSCLSDESSLLSEKQSL